MPNWCHNALTVTGEAEVLARFVEAVKEPIDEEYLRGQYDETFFVGIDRPSFEEYAKERLEQRRPLSFESLVPTPKVYDVDEIDLGGSGIKVPRKGKDKDLFPDWYAFHLERWGTKWDASFDGPFMALGTEESDVDKSVEAEGATVTPTVAVYKFDTAWSPPSPWVEAASEKFPELEFTLQYAEVGNGFAGRDRYKGGVVIDSEELDVEDVLAPEEMWY